MTPHPNGYVTPSYEECGDLMVRMLNRAHAYEIAHGDALLFAEAREAIAALRWELDQRTADQSTHLRSNYENVQTV